MSEDSSLSKLRQLGQRFLKSDTPRPNVKDQPLPAGVGAERRSGRRVPLPLAIRVQIGKEEPRNAKIRDVNLTGVAMAPVYDAKPGDLVSIRFDGYPEVCPAFTMVGRVRRILAPEEPGGIAAMGLEIDRNATSAEAQKNYRRLVLHYLHHRPLLEGMASGYFEGRCTSCDWVGRVGRRKPQCSRCGAKVVALGENA